MTVFSPAWIKEMECLSDPRALLANLHARFGGRLAIGTSGQLTGAVLIDLCFAAGFTPRVFTNDTLRLFPETMAFFQQLEKRYGFSLERYTPETKVLDEMVSAYGEYLFLIPRNDRNSVAGFGKFSPTSAR
ncbi:MAG: phosphoadenosine phosphosulfate reductase family protein [Elusimicrobia bacterium]|nr:phosphoadenosine phosphosulfate reductase family protein [Elusimicrobiota bacterium]